MTGGENKHTNGKQESSHIYQTTVLACSFFLPDLLSAAHRPFTFSFLQA
jgi:hypothetical protein